jgi:hypothetical protein
VKGRLVALALVLLVVLHPLAQAGSKEGPRRWTKTLKKNSEVIYKITFVASNNETAKYAEFAVIGDGSTDVDIEVHDERGKVVAQDTFYSDLALVRWSPAATQTFTIRVKNLGAEDNVCHMGHN